MLAALTATGIGTSVLHRAVTSLAQDEEGITAETIKQAEWITGLELSEEDREELVSSVKQTNSGLDGLRKVELDHSIAPAMHFQPLNRSNQLASVRRDAQPTEWTTGKLPDNDEAIAFLPVSGLAAFVRSGQLTSTRLTKIYLERLKKFGPMLRCVVTLTEELALQQAAKADQEIAAGKYRGPLHGIPWGAKDLIAVDGYPTSWGIPVHKERVLNDTATVARRLEFAGAVLVAKLSLGAIAMGDKWFEGLTRSPWNAKIGSSGSSAGSASATVAGLVGFSLGSETLGSILSPCTRCGASGLRPTFGRVSRHGCMPLSWSMDKIGPICRSIEDCALVFDAIHGEDGRDATAANFDFSWPTGIQVSNLKVGYVKGRRELSERTDLQPIRDLGCELVEIELPRTIPLRAMTNIIDVEGAAVFDDLLRQGETEGWNSWTRTFQAAQFISAIDYLRFQRARTKLMHEYEKSIAGVDVLFNCNDLVHTNFTGHPSAVLPRTYRGDDVKTPMAAVFTGHLNQDATVLALAAAYQNRVDAHLQHPPLSRWLGEFENGTLDPKPKPKKGNEESGEAKQGDSKKR
jgi:Asp-tRNA(Asn)/Glu-tRNA(Gln) amidotransferase A subunit family amidase